MPSRFEYQSNPYGYRYYPAHPLVQTTIIDQATCNWHKYFKKFMARRGGLMAGHIYDADIAAFLASIPEPYRTQRRLPWAIYHVCVAQLAGPIH